MVIDALFSGSALGQVDAAGRTQLPPFVLRVLERRCRTPQLVFGSHEFQPCINAYDEGYEVVLYADIERRRLREETAGIPAAVHHSRARRTFGIAELASFDPDGGVVLPPMMRRRGRIGRHALFIGVGGSFEIWNPALARAAEDEQLRELTEFAFSDAAPGEEDEVS